MEHRLVALLIVTIALTGCVSGSVLHEPGVSYQHVLPYEVTYSNSQSPVLLSQPLGLTVDELLAAAGYPPSPAPVSEVSEEDISGNESATEREAEAILKSQSTPEASIAIKDTAAHLSSTVQTLSAPIALGELAPSSATPESPLQAPIAINELAASSTPLESSSLGAESPSVAPETPLPASIAEDKLASPAAAPDSPSLAAESTLPAANIKLLDSITRGAFYIDSNGKLQMQASYSSGGEGLSVVATDLSQPTAGSVPVVVPELPVVAIAKPSKHRGASNVNVNVNVNVNGDGTGSSFNATSVSKIINPIQVNHKCN